MEAEGANHDGQEERQANDGQGDDQGHRLG
jgi:hypothetical protein